jgi:hypothetical protein
VTFWQWRCWRVRARGKYSPPRNSLLFCLSLCFLLSLFLFYLCLCVCSISRNSVCSAFNGQDKNTQSWGLWLSHSITGTKCLFSVCLCVCFLFVCDCFLSVSVFVSYLFVIVFCLSLCLFLICLWLFPACLYVYFLFDCVNLFRFCVCLFVLFLFFYKCLYTMWLHKTSTTTTDRKRQYSHEKFFFSFSKIERNNF